MKQYAVEWCQLIQKPCEYCGCEMEIDMVKSSYADDDFEYMCVNPDCVVNEV